MQYVKPLSGIVCAPVYRASLGSQAKDGEIKQHQRDVELLMEKEKVLRQEDAELRRIKVNLGQGGILAG